MHYFLSPMFLKTVLTILVTLLLAIITDNILRSLIKVPKGFDSRRANTYIRIIKTIITILVYAVAINGTFIMLGISITPLLTTAGIAGVFVGLGAQSILKDLIAGFFILSQESIVVGDYVKLGETEGYIEAIKFRTTHIRAQDGALHIIPNGMINILINYSSHHSHVLVDIPAKSDSSIEVVLKTMETALIVLEKDKDLGSFVLPGSVVNGIEDFKAVGPMIVRTTIITYPSRRLDIGRRYRQLVKKEFEKHKLNFG